ncbi:PH domain-containing protein [Nocardioides rubriscoriae]|uniref:PH domain-containing protein n=1 Tax=Nocardioides rubriscoriae TaxID=642762 RepID=UPI0011DF9633|nr:PH domain-containing protein [Nocardioides rubriscoriae]
MSLPVAPSDWQRLDPRMLLVHPVRELVRFLPALLVLTVAGSASSGPPWELLGVVAAVAVGILRYLTTRYRVAAGRIELKRGLLSRRITSAPLDRVRTVDLTSSVIQRVLGLTTLRIGTGLAAADDSDALDLDGLPVDRARALRADLLHTATVGVLDRAGTPPDDGRTLVAFDPRWLRFAPFTGTGLVVVAATIGGATQLLDSLGVWRDLRSDDLPVTSVVGVCVAAAAGLLVLLTLSVLGYLVTNGGFRLTQQGGAWHVRRGLLTTRETSIDEERLAGVSLGEPLALRLTGGRHLQAIVTGVDRSETGSSTLVPPSDADVAPRAAGLLLGHDAPVAVALTPHGPAAARRRWTRALVPVVPVVAAAVVVGVREGSWWLLVPAGLLVLGAAALAADRVAGLGHALSHGHVVARSGSLARRREILGVDHVIGWNLRATWFQRRAGLTELAATTAGGGGSVRLLDVPEADAVRLADQALPGLVEQFFRA